MAAAMPIANLFQKCSKHFFRNFKVVDCATTNRTMNFEVAWFAPQMLLRRSANGQDFFCVLIKRNNRRLVQDDAAAGHKDQGVYGTEIHCQVFDEKIT